VIQTSVSVSFQDLPFTRTESTPDLYVFCMAAAPDVLPQYGDTVVRIHDPESFCAALSTVVQAEFRGIHPCRYGERIRPHTRWGADTDEFAEIVKPRRYAPEKEVRAIWKPLKEPIAPFVTMVSSLPRYCEVYEPVA
jgi:hypothetical protein